MSVIIRLQNLPWSANALDIRNFFRGLSIPEGGVHIVGGELGDAFIAFSTDEDARQGMMLDGGKIKEIQVKLLLSSRSEMHKVIEAARQNVPLSSLASTAPVVSVAATPTPPVVSNPPQPPIINPFSAALGTNSLSSYGIPGIGNPQEIPQPAVIEPPAPLISPTIITPNDDDDDRQERRRSREKDRRRSRSRSRSRDRDRKDRKRDRRDRSRSRDRRRRDRSRSRERRDRKKDRKDRSRSRDRSPSRKSRERRDRKSPRESQERIDDNSMPELPVAPMAPSFGMNQPPMSMMQVNMMQNGPLGQSDSPVNRFNDPSLAETFNKLQELGKKRNPNAFQGEQQNGGRFQPPNRGGATRGGGTFRREGRTRFDDDQRECCVAIRNAPNHTSYGDVRRFFPYLIDKHGIKMINDNMGHRTGTIFVRFCDPRSRNLALQRKINELKGAMVIVEALDDEAYESAVDSYLPYRKENDDDVIITDDFNSEASFTVLKLTDLPHFVKEHDIIKMFSEFSLLSVLLNDCKMSRSKIAYVQFVKPEDAKLALEKKESYLFGRRQPTIVPISDEDFEREKTLSEISGPKIDTGRGTSNNQDQSITAPRDPRQRRFDNGSGQTGPPAKVSGLNQPPPFLPGPFPPQQGFPGPFGAPQFGTFPAPPAIDPRAASSWTNRPPFPNPMNSLNPIIDNNSQPKALSKSIEDEPLDCVLMKGLPRDATDRTIVSFLSDTGAVPTRIHLMLDSGMPSGDCFCEFRSAQDAQRAIAKHGSTLEGCTVSVDLVPRSVVEDALEGPKNADIPRESLLGTAPQVPPFFEPSMRGGFGPRFRGRGGFDRGYDRGGFNRGGFDRGSYRGRGGYDRGRGFERGRGRGFGRGRGGYNNGDNRNEEESDPALEDFGAPGCVVSMENVPFRATIDDIMNFFSEFDLTQDDVIRRYNERGQPTGDARVAFQTPFDAQRAVKTRHMDTINDRRINLKIL